MRDGGVKERWRERDRWINGGERGLEIEGGQEREMVGGS